MQRLWRSSGPLLATLHWPPDGTDAITTKKAKDPYAHDGLGHASPAITRRDRAFGAAMAAHLPRTCCIGLSGTLGSGKTYLTQSVANAVGIAKEDATSPTFTLVQSYQGPQQAIIHVDAYRIADIDEFLEVGIEEILETPDSWVFVEWADRFPELFSESTLWIELKPLGEESREATFFGNPDKWQAIVNRILADA